MSEKSGDGRIVRRAAVVALILLGGAVNSFAQNQAAVSAAEKAAFSEQLNEYLSDPANVEQLQKRLAEPANVQELQTILKEEAEAQPKAKAAVAGRADKSLAELVAPDSEAPTLPKNPTWGEFDPGRGFLVGRSELGELSFSAFALMRYLNQLPGEQEWTDHLGNTYTTDGREDIYSHRIMLWAKGWVFDPKLIYTITFWTVNTTDQNAIFANVGYQFCKSFNLGVGVVGNGGSRSLAGSHPYWLANDRVMADEFFRPFFTQGLYANGEVAPGVMYQGVIGNNSSILGTKASQLDRNQTYSGTLWWMPTTGEFGPRGGYGDFEMHDKLATRFGIGSCYSPEQRYNETGDPQNTSLKLADGLNLFSAGSLAPGVTIQNADYTGLSMDAGMKYKGFFLQAEYYFRWLNEFDADGALPVEEIFDTGFYVQAATFLIPKKIEGYVATSQIFGDDGAGFGNSSEYLTGLNFYPFNSRDTRLNVQYIRVMDSPVGSTFGYYTTGQNGDTISVAYMLMF
jgi:hypothetical protein